MIDIFRFISRPMSLCYIISFYLLTAVFFAFCYQYFIPVFEGGPALIHNTMPGTEAASVTLLDSLYFSITSQTTVGFGDIIPATISARVIIMVQVIFGYFYLGLVVAFITARMILRSKKFEAVLRRLKNEMELH